MRRILLKLVFTVMLFLTMCLRIPAFAGEAATVPLMEANDETMVDIITENLIKTLLLKSNYLADLDRETLVLLEYEGDFSIVADLYPSGEHVMTVNVSVIPTESIPKITGMLSW